MDTIKRFRSSNTAFAITASLLIIGIILFVVLIVSSLFFVQMIIQNILPIAVAFVLIFTLPKILGMYFESKKPVGKGRKK
jgi:Mn2+/Fe2+ NRAMP family transporter